MFSMPLHVDPSKTCAKSFSNHLGSRSRVAVVLVPAEFATLPPPVREISSSETAPALVFLPLDLDGVAFRLLLGVVGGFDGVAAAFFTIAAALWAEPACN